MWYSLASTAPGVTPEIIDSTHGHHYFTLSNAFVDTFILFCIVIIISTNVYAIHSLIQFLTLVITLPNIYAISPPFFTTIRTLLKTLSLSTNTLSPPSPSCLTYLSYQVLAALKSISENSPPLITKKSSKESMEVGRRLQKVEAKVSSAPYDVSVGPFVSLND